MMLSVLLLKSGLDFGNLLGSVPGSVAQGMIWGVMALGLYISFRMLRFSDLSVDGTFTTGAAVTVMLMLNGWSAPLAMLVAFLAGMAAGAVTGLLHTAFGIPDILSGILTQFALFSVNLAIMGFTSNKAISVDKFSLIISSRSIGQACLVALIFCAIIIAIMYWYFGTEHGSAMRATGCNPEMAKAQGININVMKVIGLALSNGIVALSGALMAQYQGFADNNMGRGAIVIGLAAIVIGEVLCDAILRKHHNFAATLAFVVAGGILYYLIINIVLWLKLNANLLKLFTAIIVAIFLAVPYLQQKSKTSFGKAGKNSGEGGAAHE